jgi:hypothetical protein
MKVLLLLLLVTSSYAIHRILEPLASPSSLVEVGNGIEVALRTVQAFLAASPPSHFRGIDPQIFGERLKVLVEKPVKLKQQAIEVCAIATFFFSLDPRA